MFGFIVSAHSNVKYNTITSVSKGLRREFHIRFFLQGVIRSGARCSVLLALSVYMV